MKRILRMVAIWVAAVYLVSLVVIPGFQKDGQIIPPGTMESGQRVACIDDNVDALTWRLRMIESAKRSVTLVTFGFSLGESGQDLLASLYAAARRGVAVKLLLDGFHGKKTVTRSTQFQALAAHENVELRLYNPIDLLRPWKANYRMHDKFLIADGMYLLGGRNSNDLFLGDDTEHPNIDRDVFVAGSSVSALRDYFATLWEDPACRVVAGARDASAENAMQTRYAGRKVQAFAPGEVEKRTMAARGVALLWGQPHAGNKEPIVWNALRGYLQQGEDVLIQTPYIICGDRMYRDLKALTEQGKSVTVLTNAPETGANPFGCADYLNQKEAIAATGVTVWEYAGSRSLHAKTVLVDESLSIVGSFNLDMRSAYLDTETMLVIDCPQLNADLRRQMTALAEESVPREFAPGRRIQLGLLQMVAGFLRHLL